jgi:hypothetical protein
MPNKNRSVQLRWLIIIIVIIVAIIISYLFKDFNIAIAIGTLLTAICTAMAASSSQQAAEAAAEQARATGEQVKAAAEQSKRTAEQVELSRQSISVDTLLRLDAHFNSPDMKANRSKAAAYLLKLQFKEQYQLLITQYSEGACRIALEDLLDFFEGIAFLSRRKDTPDPESVWCFFFYWIDHYYWAAECFIKEVQSQDPTRLQEFVLFREQLEQIERKHHKEYKHPTKEQLRNFLLEEKIFLESQL